MPELHTANHWAGIYGTIIIEPTGFGEHKEDRPAIRDLMDEQTFYKCINESTFYIEDFSMWGSRVDNLTNDI